MNTVQKTLTATVALSIISLYPTMSYADSDARFTHGKWTVSARTDHDRGHRHNNRHNHRPAHRWNHHHDRDRLNITFHYVTPPRYYYDRVVFKPRPVVRYYTPAPVIVQQAPVVIEQAPVQIAAAAPSTMDTFTINVPNARGAYTAVVIRRSGEGFVGPQGEFYESFPLVSELKVIYGA